jgi:hypothetical protein
MSSPLPGVETQHWQVDRETGFLYYVDEGVRYKVAQMMIIANGTHDLCVAVDEHGNLNIKKTSETPEERILGTSKYDWLWVEFEKPIRGTQWSMVMEVNEVIKRMVDVVLSYRPFERWAPGQPGKDFEMYAREKYHCASPTGES